MDDLLKVYDLNKRIDKQRTRYLGLMYENRGQMMSSYRKNNIRADDTRMLINKLILERNDELGKIYSHMTIKARIIVHRKLKIVSVVVEPHSIKFVMIPPSFIPSNDKEGLEHVVYPDDVTDRRPFNTIARYRATIGESTDFRAKPLAISEDSIETVVLVLEAFAQQFGAKLSFSNNEVAYDKATDEAVCGIAHLGSTHLLANEIIITAKFLFQLVNIDYDKDLAQSSDSTHDFVFNFCGEIAQVLSCDTDYIRVFSIDKPGRQSKNASVSFGITTPDPERTEQLANDLQTRARSGFPKLRVLLHVKAAKYQWTWVPVLSYLQVRSSDFNPLYNSDYRQPGLSDAASRGSYQYHLPIGWYRHALEVDEKYPGSSVWLGHVNADGEWPVAFHGTHWGSAHGIVQHGVLSNAAKTYATRKETIQEKGPEMNRPGLYLTTHCNGGCHPMYTQRFSIPMPGEKSETFRIVFQCRVEPGKFTSHRGPVNIGHAWRFVDPHAIRPYGILLKKEEDGVTDQETSN